MSVIKLVHSPVSQRRSVTQVRVDRDERWRRCVTTLIPLHTTGRHPDGRTVGQSPWGVGCHLGLYLWELRRPMQRVRDVECGWHILQCDKYLCFRRITQNSQFISASTASNFTGLFTLRSKQYGLFSGFFLASE